MSPWQRHNLAAINQRLAPVRHMRPGLLFEQVSPHNHIVVRRTTDQLVLCYRHSHHRIEEVESRLDLRDPLALLSEYTQMMLLALVWQPQPRRILLIGLGGGRLQMVLHHYLEDAGLCTVELDPTVVEVAQRFFGITPDERQHIIVQDGRDYVRSTPEEVPYDLILLDAYRADGIPLHLRTYEFYSECRTLLIPGGVVATNLQSGTRLYDATRKTFAAAFLHTRACSLLGGNVVVIGTDTPPLSLREIRDRAERVEQRFLSHFPLSHWVQMMVTEAPYNPRAPVLRDAELPRQ